MRLQTMAQSSPIRQFRQIQNQNPTRPNSTEFRKELNSVHHFEFEDEDEADVESQALHFPPITDFEIPFGNSNSICRAQPTNGLLLIHSSSELRVHKCNPITREYIELWCPDECIDYLLYYGFGVSKISGQYKVVCINGDARSDSHHVYTLGTRTWRRVEASAASGFTFCFIAYIVCNGNPHWTVFDSAHVLWFCAFDLETECFSIFSAPAEDGFAEPGPAVDVKLDVLRDCLCLSYKLGDRVVIWLMKEYRVKESWTMAYEFSIDSGFGYGFSFDFWNLMDICSIKVFKNGDVLMFMFENSLVCFSNKAGTIQQLNMLTDGNSDDGVASAMIYTPSLFSLKNFGVENVISF